MGVTFEKEDLENLGYIFEVKSVNYLKAKLQLWGVKKKLI